MSPRALVISGILIALGGSARAWGQSSIAPQGYTVHEEIPVPVAGMHGARLQLLEDARIRPGVRTAFQRGLPDDACASPSTDTLRDFCASAARTPLRRAMVRLVGATASEVDTMTVERPIADLRRVIAPRRTQPPVYGVEFDLSADFGSYSGPLVELLDLRDGHVRPMRARDANTDSSVVMFLPTTLKTAWRTAPAKHGSGLDILLVACRPTFDSSDGGFRITYSRFSWDGRQWRRYDRTAPGIWENDGEFPQRSLFP